MSLFAWKSYLLPHRSLQTPTVARLLIAAASGALLSLSFHGSFPNIFAWFCPALLFSTILGARPRVAFACGFLHALLFVVTCVSWIAEVLAVHGGMSVAAGWGVLLVIALVWSTAQGLTTWAMQRLSTRSYTLALLGAPFLWICVEVFRAYLPEISFPWALLGYAPSENAALLQLATLTGIYGLSFLAAAFNALLVWTDCGPRGQRKQRFAILGAVILVLLLIGGIGPRFVPRAEAH